MGNLKDQIERIGLDVDKEQVESIMTFCLSKNFEKSDEIRAGELIVLAAMLRQYNQLEQIFERCKLIEIEHLRPHLHEAIFKAATRGSLQTIKAIFDFDPDNGFSVDHMVDYLEKCKEKASTHARTGAFRIDEINPEVLAFLRDRELTKSWGEVDDVVQTIPTTTKQRF